MVHPLWLRWAFTCNGKLCGTNTTVALLKSTISGNWDSPQYTTGKGAGIHGAGQVDRTGKNGALIHKRRSLVVTEGVVVAVFFFCLLGFRVNSV